MEFKLPVAKLEEFGASLTTSKEGFTVNLRSGKHFGVLPFPVDPAALTVSDPIRAPKPEWAAQQSIRTYASFDEAQVTLAQNRDLSDYGREQRMIPVRDAALKQMAFILKDFSEHQTSVQDLEIQRYRPPRLRPDDVVGALRDSEIRNAVRGMGTSERTELMRALADGRDDELLGAVLRSPLRVGNLEIMANEGWRKLVNERDPDGHALLELAKRSVDWAKKIVLPVQVKLVKELGYAHRELYEKVKPFGAAAAFGFSANDRLNYDRMALAMQQLG